MLLLYGSSGTARAIPYPVRVRGWYVNSNHGRYRRLIARLAELEAHVKPVGSGGTEDLAARNTHPELRQRLTELGVDPDDHIAPDGTLLVHGTEEVYITILKYAQGMQI